MKRTKLTAHAISFSMIVIAVIIFVLVAPVKNAASVAKQNEKIAVSVVTATRRAIEDVLHVNGTLFPRQEAVISAKMPGRIEKLYADIGYVVTKTGDVLDLTGRTVSKHFIVAEQDVSQLTLGKLSAAQSLLQAKAGLATAQAAELQANAAIQQADAAITQVRARVKQAEAAVSQADANLKTVQADYDRVAALLKKNAVSRQKFDHVTAALDSAKAMLDQAQQQKAVAEAAVLQAVEQKKSADAALTQVKQQKAVAESRVHQAKIGVQIAELRLNDATITAPIPGTITIRKLNIGELAMPGKMICKLERVDSLDLKAAVSSLYLDKLAVGNAVRVHVDSIPDVITATVSQIAPSVDQRVRTVILTIPLDNAAGTLRPGLFATVDVILKRHENALVIPHELVQTRHGKSFVFRVTDAGTAEKTEIGLGIRQGEFVEVVSGLNAGDRIVSVGRDQLSGGESVIVSGDNADSTKLADEK